MSPALSQTNAKPSLLISALLSCTLSPSPCFAGLLCPCLGNPTWARAASSPVFMLRRGSLSLVLCFPEGPPGPEANVSQDILVVKLPNSLSLPSLTPAQERKYLVILKEKKKRKEKKKKQQCSAHSSPVTLALKGFPLPPARESTCPGGESWGPAVLGKVTFPRMGQPISQQEVGMM